MVTSGIIPLSAVGNIQTVTYKALIEGAYARNVTVDFRTYSACQGLCAPVGITQMPCCLGEMLSDKYFQESDIIFFSFWGLCNLIDALPFAPSRAQKVVFYHGITPPHLYPEQAINLEEGYKQAIVLNEADIVFATSDHIASDVFGFGVPRKYIHKVPLFAEPLFPPPIPLREPARKKVRLTFLSRFCSAKGVNCLFDALTQWQDADWSLNVIYHADHSDSMLLEQYKRMTKKRWKGRVCWHATIDDDEKMCILEDTDILVMPSLHEGFCVPIIEALGKGCALIYSDAGSLPEVGADLGLQFPARNVPMLVECLDKAAQSRRRGMYATATGELTASGWRDRAQSNMNYFSYENFKTTLCEQLFSNFTEKRNVDKLLSARRVATLNALGLPTHSASSLPQYMIDSVCNALQQHSVQSVPLCVANTAENTNALSELGTHQVSVFSPYLQSIIQDACAVEEAVEAVYHSLSWKLSAPLRALGTIQDCLKIAFCRKDPLREAAHREWEIMVASAQTVVDWQQVLYNRRQQLSILHSSLSWKMTGILRCVYSLIIKK